MMQECFIFQIGMNDYMKVYDGDTESHSLLAYFSGANATSNAKSATSNIPNITSTQEKMRISFFSDNDTSSDGPFHLKIHSELDLGPQNGDDDYCTPETPCGQDEGNCQTNDQCLEGYRCGYKNCPSNLGFASDTNCCFDRAAYCNSFYAYDENGNKVVRTPTPNPNEYLNTYCFWYAYYSDGNFGTLTVTNYTVVSISRTYESYAKDLNHLTLFQLSPTTCKLLAYDYQKAMTEVKESDVPEDYTSTQNIIAMIFETHGIPNKMNIYATFTERTSTHFENQTLGDNDYCSGSNLCAENGGDCDFGSHCANDGSICGNNNCPSNMGYPNGTDCCQSICQDGYLLFTLNPSCFSHPKLIVLLKLLQD